MINLIELFKSDINIGNFIIPKESVYSVSYKLFITLLILLLMFIAFKVGEAIISRIVDKQKKFKFSLDERKSQTMGAVLKSILRYTVCFVGIFVIVEIWFGTIGLTLAGIGGVAVGFGSQSLVKDMINGFFILFEDQYSVGDYINIDDKGGIVESIELRITRIRGFNGDLHTIPNGSITKVTNHSRGDLRILVEVEISHQANLDKAIEEIEALCIKFKEENEDVVEGPEVLGISALKATGITISIAGKTKSWAQYNLEMKLRKQVRDILNQANIKMPYSTITCWRRSKGMLKEFNIGDIVELKKTHPCGSKEWEIIRVGADIKIKCVVCGRLIMLPRNKFEKDVKKIVKENKNIIE